MRRTQAERTRFGFTGDVFPYLVEKFLVGVTFVTADVDYECAAVGYDIAWFRDYRFPKESALLGPVKMSVTMVNAGTQHNVYGVVAFVPGSMP